MGNSGFSIRVLALQRPNGKYVGRWVITNRYRGKTKESVGDCVVEFDTEAEAEEDAAEDILARLKGLH